MELDRGDLPALRCNTSASLVTVILYTGASVSDVTFEHSQEMEETSADFLVC